MNDHEVDDVAFLTSVNHYRKCLGGRGSWNILRQYLGVLRTYNDTLIRRVYNEYHRKLRNNIRSDP